MERSVCIMFVVFIQMMFAMVVAGCIIALYCHELIIALLCATMKSMLKIMWREALLLLDSCKKEGDT